MDNLCLQVKKELTSDFSSTSATTLQHILDCDNCKNYYESMKAFYDNLSSALSIEVPGDLESNIFANISFDETLTSAVEVDVPEGLESRILLAQRMSEADTSNVHVLKPHAKSTITSKNGGYKWLSIAAGLVLAIGLSIGTYQLGESHGLEQHVFAHINQDLYALDRNDNIQLASFNKMFESQGIQANNNIGTIKYAGNCPVDGKMVPHFVLDFNGFSLTVAYLADESATKHSIKNDLFDGVLVGAKKGSFMILSSGQKLSNDMQEHVFNSIEIVDI
ncbi:MAG: DUF3379 family protein [Gammaproteobacteria bacterium]